MTTAGIILFALGAFLTLVNVYLSFLRYPIHLARGGTRETFRWVSGFPVFGSMFLWVSVGLLPWTGLRLFAGILSIFDTGGLHWFVGTMCWIGAMWLKGKLGNILRGRKDPRHYTTRVRTFAGIAAILTIGAGLAVRQWLPWGFWAKYSGVALWSVVVYALVVFVWPRVGVARCAAIALLISWAVEFAQLTPVPGWLASKHPGLRMIFGEHFSLGDLPAYAVGVLLAAITHVLAVTPRPRPSPSHDQLE